MFFDDVLYVCPVKQRSARDGLCCSSIAGNEAFLSFIFQSF